MRIAVVLVAIPGRGRRSAGTHDTPGVGGENRHPRLPRGFGVIARHSHLGTCERPQASYTGLMLGPVAGFDMKPSPIAIKGQASAEFEAFVLRGTCAPRKGPHPWQPHTGGKT